MVNRRNVLPVMTVATLVADFAALTQAQPPNNKSRVTHGFPLH